MTNRELMQFLCGEAPLDGVWFGEAHPTETGKFWWRKHVRARLAQPEPDGKCQCCGGAGCVACDARCLEQPESAVCYPHPAQPEPPAECKTDAEKRAFAFGWWKALESNGALIGEDVPEADFGNMEPVAWHEPGAYGNVTVYEKWATENGWLPLYTAPPQRECQWKPHDDVHMPDTWEGACGSLWTFTEGGPKHNNMSYCPECGGTLKEKNT